MRLVCDNLGKFCFFVCCYLLLGYSSALAQKIEKGEYFYILNTSNGLSDNNVLQMLQLPNGKMVVKTQRGINIYDDSHFCFLPLLPSKAQAIEAYHGQSHIYVDNKNRLWVKDFQKIYAINLNQFQLLSHPLDSLSSSAFQDVFVDSKHEVWGVLRNELISVDSQVRLKLNPTWGELQDMDVDERHVYAFCANGIVAAYSLQGKLEYVESAYGKLEREQYDATSLVVKTPKGQFYQIRTGKNSKSIFLHFDPLSRRYQAIFTCDYILHTLNMPSDRQALVSCQRGYLMFDFKMSNKPREVVELSLPDGTSLTTGINTVYRDHDGGIWLGTYKNGLIYVSPLLGLFFTEEKPWWQGTWKILLVALGLTMMLGIFFIYRKKWNQVQLSSIKVLDGKQLQGEMLVGEDEPLVEDGGFPNTDFQKKLVSFIEQHLSESDYGVEQLACDLCMERTGLYKKLMASVGETPVSFIRNVRLGKAAELLISSSADSMTVNEIAERSGFSSPSYFTKCFKEKYGKKPSEYR